MVFSGSSVRGWEVTACCSCTRYGGCAEGEFENAFRECWMPMLVEGDEARLVWYTNQAHGSGPAYTVITVTVVRDGMAWECLYPVGPER